MKKFKKMIAMCLAAVMAMSVMSVGAFAYTPNGMTDGELTIMDEIYTPNGMTDGDLTIEEPAEDGIEPQALIYVPLNGQTAATVTSNVRPTVSYPNIYCQVGSLPNGTTVNMRLHDNAYGTDISNDLVFMYVPSNGRVTWTSRQGVEPNHSYSIMVSANGSSGNYNLTYGLSQ